MNAVTRTTSVAVLVTLGLALGAGAAEPATTTPAKSAAMGQGVEPAWIWHTLPQATGRGAAAVEASFLRTVALPPGAQVRRATLVLTADATVCRVYVNGALVAEKLYDWRAVLGMRLNKHLKPGANTLKIVAGKSGSSAGLVARLEVQFESGAPLEIVTDAQWKFSSAQQAPEFAGEGAQEPAPRPVQVLGPLGVRPWGALALVPVSVAWPARPTTQRLTAAEADALIVDDWLQHVGNDPTLDDVKHEIESARRIASRFSAHARRPSFAPELASLDQLSERAQRCADDPDAVRPLYLEVRRVKRRIVLANPAIDFSRLLLIDGSPPAGHESGHRNTYGDERKGANRILVLDSLSPDADAREVVPGARGDVMRMDLSFDAGRLVYSMVPAGGNSFHLYEVTLGKDGVATGPARQLTNSPYHDEDPIYLPDGKIAFCTTRGNTYVRCLPYSFCTVLARCDADGKNIRIISNNNEPDYTPCLLPDGRILYTRWEYTERPLWRLQKLWTMNPDGTGVAHFWGNRSYHPDVVWEARPIPGTNKVMFTGVGHHDVAGGPIGIIDTQIGRDFPDGLYKVTAEVPWTEVGDPREDNRIYSPIYRGSPQFRRFASPYPWSEHDFLVSGSGSRAPGFWLYLMDVDGNRELIYAGRGGVWCALPLRPRTPPPAIPDRVAWPSSGQTPRDGVLFSANVLESVEGLPPGKAKFLRVIQQDFKTYSMGIKSFRHSGPVISALQEDSVKRILGTVPIQPDGSVSFCLPAGRAVYFQLLDEDQRCLQIMRSFTGVMPGEVRGCTGCHESHSRATPMPSARAMAQVPVTITPPPWGAEVSISYERFAQPVLDKYCGRCHQGNGEGRKVLDLTLRGGLPERGITDPKLLPFKEPYLTLIGNTAWKSYWPLPSNAIDPQSKPNGKGWGLAGALLVEAVRGGAPLGPREPMTSLSYTSPLIQLATSGKHNNVKIQGEDLLRLIAWVDVNCVYRGEEEVRQIPDPDEELFRRSGWMVPPRTRTAPVIDRLAPVSDPPAAKKP